MPDTGAPWNIPYVAGTDLVADWPTDSQSLANAIDSALDTVAGSAAVIAVKRVGLTGTFSTTSTSYTDITGLTITYTPTDTANKILLSTSVLFDHSVVGQFIDLRHYDGSSQIDQMWRMVPRATNQRYMVTLQNEYTAASTSSTTYASQVLINSSGTLNIYNGSMTLIEYQP